MSFGTNLPFGIGMARLLGNALLLAVGILSSQYSAQAKDRVWSYTLLEGSHLIDDCPVCGRPTILQPMRGTFNLILLEENPLFARYELRDISFVAGSKTTTEYSIAGRGIYQIGGEVALLQDLELEVQIDNGFINRLSFFTNSTRSVQRVWPMIEISAHQTNGTFTQVYHFDLAAAPLREIWFSTATAFTSGNRPDPTNRISAGDLLSSAGRVVKSNNDLTRNLGIMPIVPDLGLDAIDFLPGGEMVFSLPSKVFSETLGMLRQGDLLSQRGRIVKRNEDLMAAFGLQNINVDLGLDAVQIMDDGQILFSITTSEVTNQTGTVLRRGDIISDRGQIFKTNPQLLSRFHPNQSGKDYGLDAFYIWPSGEIWFSTEEGFKDNELGPILSGDLLSDQGYRIFGNLELLSTFAPIEDRAEFGLDALFVVTDVLPPAPAPRFSGILADQSTGNLAIQGEGKGRVFQLEKSAAVAGPYLPSGPITPDLFFSDPGALTNQVSAFYRLRQW